MALIRAARNPERCPWDYILELGVSGDRGSGHGRGAGYVGRTDMLVASLWASKLFCGRGRGTKANALSKDIHDLVTGLPRGPRSLQVKNELLSD
eukprot:scaffold123677_cov34-Attheya_sp.AAC.2